MRKNKKYIIIIVVIVTLIVLSLSVNLIKNDRKLSLPERVLKDSTSFVTSIVLKPVNVIKSKIKTHKEKKNLYKKYEKLMERVEEVEKVNAKNEELKEEIEELKQLLKIDATLSEEIYLNATVINRNIGYFYNTLTINKGKKDGIDVNMAVVTKKGLIGKISKVSNNVSTVKLLTSNDSNNKISVKIKSNDKNVYGLLSSYDLDKKVYLVEGISENTKINEGDVVTTTGFSNNFPSGVYIGKVVGVTKDNFDLAQLIEVKSDVDFDNINFVTVLKRKTDE